MHITAHQTSFTVFSVMMSGCNTSDLNAYNWEGVGGWTHGEGAGGWTHGEGDIEGRCRRVGTRGGEHTSV